MSALALRGVALALALGVAALALGVVALLTSLNTNCTSYVCQISRSRPIDQIIAFGSGSLSLTNSFSETSANIAINPLNYTFIADSIFNHYDVTGPQSCRIRQNNEK